MEGSRSLDSACCSRSERTLKHAFIRRHFRFKAQIRKQGLKLRFHVPRAAAVTASLLWPFLLSAQSASVRLPGPQEIEQLVTTQRWDDVVRIVGKEPSPSADMDFCYGTALAHLGRFRDAEGALDGGQ